MRKQIIFWAATLFFSFSSFSQSKFVPYFSVSDEILSKCNKMMEVQYSFSSSIADVIETRSIYFYFENASFDTIRLMDSVVYLISPDECISKDSVLVRTKIRMKSGRMYLLKGNGESMYSLPFDDVFFPAYEQTLLMGPDNSCGIYGFYGFGNGEINYCGFHQPEKSLLPFVNPTTLSNLLLMVKLNGKWGLMNFEGHLMEDIKYDQIIFDSKTNEYSMFLNDLIAKKCKIEN
jgi:hypothetical protein